MMLRSLLFCASVAMLRPSAALALAPEDADKKVQDAKDEAAKANKAAADAQSQAAAQKQVNSDLREEIEELRSAESARRLIRYGITVGVGYSVFTPFPSRNRLESVQGGSVIGYVATFPGFWAIPADQANYCAAQWSTTDERAKTLAQATPTPEREEKAKAADESARAAADAKNEQRKELERSKDTQNLKELNELDTEQEGDSPPPSNASATRQEDSSTDYISTVRTRRAAVQSLRKADRQARSYWSALANTHGCDGPKNYDIALAKAEDGRQPLIDFLKTCPNVPKDDDERDRYLVLFLKYATAFQKAQDLLTALAPENSARICVGTKFGAYVGVAAPFKASTLVPEDTQTVLREREVTPAISFGLAFAPNALFTLLTGPMVGSVEREGGKGAPMWAWTIAFGGTLDIVNLLR